MCVLSIKVPIRKKSGNLFNEPCIYIYIYIYIWKLATVIEGNPKAPFSIVTTSQCRGGRYIFPGLFHFTLDPYFIRLSSKQGGIKYHFLSLWDDSTWDWTPISRTIDERSTHQANGRYRVINLMSKCTKWADDQHRPAGLEPWLVSDHPLP